MSPSALRLTHWFEASQKLPDTQSELLKHVEGQPALTPLQRKGVQLGLPAEPSDSGLQVPMLPLRLQASQAAPQAVVQQTPSAQKPLWHCRAEVQTVPFACLAAHCPVALQKNPTAHSALVEQLAGQLEFVPSQT
jgi:hypothetical protein